MSASATVSTSPAVRRRVAARWIALSSVSSAAVVGVYVAAVLTSTGQAVEDSILSSVDGTTLLSSGAALDAISPPAVILVVGVTMLFAFIRRRPGAAVQAGVLIVGATVTTQLIKAIAPRPDLTGEFYQNSFPSGHTTIAVASLLAIMTAFGRRSRPLLYVIGTAFAAIVAEQTVAFGWHRCSDVVGACAVSLLWLGIVRTFAAHLSRDARGVDLVKGRAHGFVSGIIGLALVACLASSGAVWAIAIGMDMSVTTSTGQGVLMGARLAAAGVVLVTAWIAWKLDRKA
ncbi:phosphatase PAP2 family protein [Frigoribacterium sp. 2-23]|uniref:phosphatase PAP2 family protein n=1 Tax=Frigoribacterium sp. 2-23 TaxID=3415006 RepID=UPI003C6F2034